MAAFLLIVLSIHPLPPSLPNSLTYTHTLILAPCLHSYTALNLPFIYSLYCIRSFHNIEAEVLCNTCYLSSSFCVNTQYSPFSTVFPSSRSSQRDNLLARCPIVFLDIVLLKNDHLKIPGNNILIVEECSLRTELSEYFCCALLSCFCHIPLQMLIRCHSSLPILC